MLRGVAQAQKEAIEKGIYLQIAIANDDDDEQQAGKIAEQLGKKSGILGVIGHYSSSVAIVTRPIYQSNSLVLVSPSSTSVDLSGKENFYRTSSNDAVAGKAIAGYLNEKNKSNPQKVVIFWSKDNSFSESLKKEAEKGLGSDKVVKYKKDNSEIFDLVSKTFNAENALNEAKKQGVTAIILIPSSEQTKNAYDVIKANTDPNLTIIGADTLHTPETIENVQKSVAKEGFRVTVPWHPFDNKEFSESAKEVWKLGKTGDVNWLTATTYDATLVLTEAIRKNPSNPSREVVKEVISEPGFIVKGGATGDIKFEGSDRINPPATLVKVLPNCPPNPGYRFAPVDFVQDCVP
jgi:eukaryotic-like serine/threonine-protein kinase